MKIAFLLIAYVCCLHAQGVFSVRIDFSRTTEARAKTEFTRGTIYYHVSQGLVLHVTDPVDQWIVHRIDTMIVYYPGENRAFLFTPHRTASVSFFQSFLGVVKEDYGLTDIGCTLSRHDTRGDTLITYWKHPEASSSDLGIITLKHVNDEIVATCLASNAGSTLVATSFKDHVAFGSYRFPLLITTIRYAEKDSSVETVHYSNPRFNTDLPDTVINFTIPREARVEKISW